MFTTRTEPVIRADVLRAFTAKRKARRQPSDLNVGSVVRTLLEEKFVKRGMSLKGIDGGKFEQSSGDTVRQVVTVKVAGAR